MNGITLTKPNVETTAVDGAKSGVTRLLEAIRQRLHEAVEDFKFERDYTPRLEVGRGPAVLHHPAGYLFSERDGRPVPLEEGVNYFVVEAGSLRRLRDGEKGTTIEVRVLEDKLLIDAGRTVHESNDRVILAEEPFRLKLLPPVYRALLRAQRGGAKS